MAKKRIRGKLISNGLIVFSVGIFVSFLFCLSFLNSAVGDAQDKSDSQEKIAKLTQDCQDLENKYLDLVAKIDQDYARSLGFINTNDADVATRQNVVARGSEGYERGF